MSDIRAQTPSSFWSTQLRTSWSNLAHLPLLKRGPSYLKMCRQMLERHFSAVGSPIVGTNLDDREKLTVIVLNHKRPENIEPIARYTLRGGFVGRLIISNNSQDYPIEKYVKIKDSRLVLLNQERPSGVGTKFELARKYPAQHYVCLDDDIFLHPAQLQWIHWSLRQAADRPHGIFGAALSTAPDADPKWPFVHLRNRIVAVEILNGLFAFTRQHLEEYFRLCGALGIDDQLSLMNGEDIILSFAGSKRPLIHNIGQIWECASASSPGVALHVSRPRFYEERWKIFSELQRMKPLVGNGVYKPMRR